MNIDKSNMRQIIIDSPLQLKKGLELVGGVKIEGNFNNVVICGIGGSALPVSILNTVTASNIPILAHKDYNLPSEANEKSLIICISYSGNTEEPISGLQEALSKNLKIIGIASGGRVEEICKKNNLPFVKIPPGIQPRSATGYIFSTLVKVLANSGIIKDLSDEILETTEEIEKMNEGLEKQGKDLAEKLFEKIPIIYASNKFKSIARIWKIKFNENSKTPSFYNYFPELNHNEMVGFSQLKKDSKFYFIILKDDQSHPRNLKRMDLFGSLLKEKGSGVSFVDIKQGSLMSKVFSTLLLGDWTSYYLALKYKFDPTPVKMVEEFKKMMAE
ncbi:MAG: bifunctional phosphoglucose/phosphomannose isomerase [bacterium]